MGRPPLTASDFHQRYVITDDGCWLWTGPMAQGYGWFSRQGAHRWSYKHHIGPIPDGHEIDHLCRVKACVNPEHLEAVTHRENVLRWAATITSCPQGHPYDDENTMRGARYRVDKNGTRVAYYPRSCRACDKSRRKEASHQQG